MVWLVIRLHQGCMAVIRLFGCTEISTQFQLWGAEIQLYTAKAEEHAACTTVASNPTPTSTGTEPSREPTPAKNQSGLNGYPCIWPVYMEAFPSWTLAAGIILPAIPGSPPPDELV
jgi:hypothetical protein